MSTTAQLLDRQLRALDDLGCATVFSDQLSGRDADRPQLQACLTYLRAGDTLVVPSLDRLSAGAAGAVLGGTGGEHRPARTIRQVTARSGDRPQAGGTKGLGGVPAGAGTVRTPPD